jgi:flagellin
MGADRADELWKRREMVTSVNGNVLAALQARENALANRTGATPTQEAGPATGPARDPAVVYKGSAEIPSLSAILSVHDSLNRAAAISDVGVSAGQTISQLLGALREKATAAQTASADQKAGLDADYQDLLKTIDQIATSASFQGVKMLDGSTGDLSFKADASGEATITLPGQDFTVGGPVLSLASTSLLGSSDGIASLLGQMGVASARLSQQLAQMRAQSDQIHGHLGAVGQLQSALAGGQPADLDADGARLQALQLQQALSGQGAGLANQAPQALLSLFRSA